MVRLVRAVLAGVCATSAALLIASSTASLQGLPQTPAQPPASPPASGTAPAQAPAGPQRGGGRTATNDLTDFSPKPPYVARGPEEEARGFLLPTGYRMELVAADPDVISPAVIEFDGNGRMYVSELISYMMDAEATREHDPISRISRWESTKGDGDYDKHTVFVDKVVAPRMILPLQDGVILTSETDSDDSREVDRHQRRRRRRQARSGVHRHRPERRRQHRAPEGRPPLEHGQLDLHDLQPVPHPLDADRLPARADRRERRPVGPGVGRRRQAVVRGRGRRARPDELPVPDSLRRVLAVSAGRWRPRLRPRVGAPAAAPAPPAAPNPNCPPGMENGFEKDFAVVWPAPGIGDMQGGIFRTRMPAQNLNHFTATTGPAIFRGDALPADLKGQLLFTEPVGRLIRRAAIENIEGLTQLRNVYPNAEFLTSDDQLFRPVNISNAPDGTLYIADMYHGIIQELQWSGPGEYLRAKIEQYQARQGRGARPHLAAALRRPRGGARDRHEHRPAGDSGNRAALRAAADVQRDAGAAGRASHAPERLVARHGAAAARPQAGQVGRPRAAADGPVVRQPRRAVPRAVDARGARRARRGARARAR